MELSKIDEALKGLKMLSQFAREAGLVPPNLTLPQCMAILQAGRELGLQPLQSLRMMGFVQGRLVMSVQLQLGLFYQKGGCVVEVKEDATSCTVILERNGRRIQCSYTMEDAVKAGLIRPGSSWEKYPRQMLRWRAIGDALRLLAPDIVMGLLSPEEAEAIALDESAQLPATTPSLPEPSKRGRRKKPVLKPSDSPTVQVKAKELNLDLEEIDAIWEKCLERGCSNKQFAHYFNRAQTAEEVRAIPSILGKQEEPVEESIEEPVEPAEPVEPVEEEEELLALQG